MTQGVTIGEGGQSTINLPETGRSKINTVKANGQGIAKAVMFDTGIVQDRQNNIIVFNIDNSGAGATDEILRIGGVANAPDFASLIPTMPNGASDSATITDDFGVGCKKLQQFSQIVSHKPVLVGKIKIIGETANDIQLNQSLIYKSVQIDGTLDAIVQNISFTQEKQDQRENLVEKESLWLIDSQQYLEYTILAGKRITLYLELLANNSAVAMKPMVRS